MYNSGKWVGEIRSAEVEFKLVQGGRIEGFEDTFEVIWGSSFLTIFGSIE